MLDRARRKLRPQSIAGHMSANDMIYLCMSRRTELCDSCSSNCALTTNRWTTWSLKLQP